MNKQGAKVAVKKKKKKRKSKKPLKPKKSGLEGDGDNDEYGFEDNEDSNPEDEDDQDYKDRKICAKSTEFKKVLELCGTLKEKFPQFGIDGERNIWIVKPAGSSRGRGICLFRNLVEILDLTKQIETQYIC